MSQFYFAGISTTYIQLFAPYIAIFLKPNTSRNAFITVSDVEAVFTCDANCSNLRVGPT